MLRGITEINLDAKGRLAMPTRYRQYINDCCEGQLIMTIDKEYYNLLIYPQPNWEEIERKLVELPSFDKKARVLQRFLIGYATEVEMDGNGRLLIPSPLREFAQLDKRVVLIGQGNKFELWDDQRWCEHRTEWLNESNESDHEGGLSEQLRAFSL